jgi:hypothetical protein
MREGMLVEELAYALAVSVFKVVLTLLLLGNVDY